MAEEAKKATSSAPGPGTPRQGASPRLPGDAILALVLESTRLYGTALLRNRSGWTRGSSGAWPLPVATPTETSALETPATATPATTPAPIAPSPAAALAESLSQARTTLQAGNAVLALPTSLLLLRILRLPTLAQDELAEAILLQMDKLSPFPGDELAIGWEVLATDAEELIVFAAAVPDRHMQVIDQACTQSGVRVLRVEVALLAWWQVLRDQRLLPAGDGRLAVLLQQGDEWDLLVLDRGLPVLARGLGRPVEPEDLARELTLSLFQTEMEAGILPLQEVLLVSATPPPPAIVDAIRATVSVVVRTLPTPEHATAAAGVCQRTIAGASLDLTPQSWHQREESDLTRRRIVRGLAAALGLWAALVAVLLLGPMATDQLTNWQKRRLSVIAAEHQQVHDMRERVRLIRRYMDRSSSLLESLRAICAAQPPGVELSEFSYDREKGVKLKGDATIRELVYNFKEQTETTAPFRTCRLGAVVSTPGSSKSRFEMEASFGEGSR